MTDEERRVEAAAEAACIAAHHCVDIRNPKSCAQWQSHVTEARAVIDAYNRPLEPEKPATLAEAIARQLRKDGLRPENVGHVMSTDKYAEVIGRIAAEVAERWYEVLPKCHDCGVEAGKPHVDGCDVARCTECGFQRIGCEHGNSELGWGHVWTGVFPGVCEVSEGLASDLNDLARKAMFGHLAWDGNRWRARVADDIAQHCSMTMEEAQNVIEDTIQADIDMARRGKDS